MNISTGTYYPQLDGLRAFGVLGVLFYHVYDIRPYKETMISAAYELVVKLRDLPIYLFFILSGYLITRILFSLRDKTRRYAKFYLNRFLRILPMYYFVLIILYLIFPGLLGQVSVPWRDQVFYWIPVANSAMALNHMIIGPEHFWTLCIEFQFYLLIPLIVFSFSTENITRILLAGLGISFLSKLLFIQFQFNPFYSSLCRMDIVILGCLAAIYPFRVNKPAYFAGYTGFLITLLVYFIFFQNENMNWAFRLTALSLVCLAILIFTLQQSGVIRKILGHPVFRHVAKTGYSTYVFHPFCIYGYYRYFGQHHYATDLFLCILISLTAGYGGYLLIEYPMNKVRAHLQLTYLPTS